MAERRVPRQLELEPSTSALVVLDAQALFMAPDGPFENRSAGAVAEALNRVLKGCRSSGVPVVFSNYVLRADLADAGLLRELSSVAAGHWSEGSPWIEVDPRIDVAGTDLRVSHHRPSAFFGTDLDSMLEALGTRALLLAGLSVNNAISATARDAFARDLPALVVRDCVGAAASEPADELEIYFAVLDRWTAEVVTSEELLRRLEAARGDSS